MSNTIPTKLNSANLSNPVRSIRWLILAIFILGLSAQIQAQSFTPEQQYRQLQQTTARGWNTWNTRSVFSHVLLPQGLAVNLGFESSGLTVNRYLHEAYLSSKEPRPETVRAGYHAYDGSYTECTLTWEGAEVHVETAHVGSDLVLLVTPLKLPTRAPSLVVEVGMLWNQSGAVTAVKTGLLAQVGKVRLAVQATAPVLRSLLPLPSSHMRFSLEKPVGISVGKVRNLDTIRAVVARQRVAFEETLRPYGTARETYLVQQSALAWNLIYDPELRVAVAPVSRCWNTYFGGKYVLFGWDTYFAAYLAGLDNRALAYANAVEVTKGIDRWGMVPNYVAGGGLGSPDRSQPPVGSLVIRELYRKYGDRWLVELTFDRLLRWNRWWPQHRDTGGLLCWGTNNLPPDGAAHTWQGAAYESGLDNSPMFDGVPFDPKTSQMSQADVGLTSLYVADCKALADLARVLGRLAQASELLQRAEAYGKALQTLWSEEKGIFLNRRTDTGTFSERLSPTLFYPMLAGVATPAQARRMVNEHLLNPQEFWGDWVLPATPRNDPAFREQNYWRGRIWAPLNFLVYLGLRNYDLPQARNELSEKSSRLLMKVWTESRSVSENFHASGVGRLPQEALNLSDSFYHWGALMGFMTFLEQGRMGRFEQPLSVR